jgi:hypothetical protein
MADERPPGRTSGTAEGVDPLAGSHPRRRPGHAPASAGADAAPADDAELDRRDRGQSRQRKAPGPVKAGAAPKPARRGPDDPPPSDPAPAVD